MLQFTTGTINEPDAGSVGTAMVEQIRDDLVAHAAWELVEEYTPASTMKWYIFKCLATESGLPADFYAVIGRTLATGKLQFFICETYTAATHTAQHFTPSSCNAVYDSSGRNPTTFVLGTAALTSGADKPKQNIEWAPSGTSTKWWLIVDDDGFTVAFNGASNGFVHAGAFTPLSVLSITMPLQIIGSASFDGAITRNPAVPGETSTGFPGGLNIIGGGNTSVAENNGPVLGFQGYFQYLDALQGDLKAVAEMGIVMAQGSSPANFPEIYGWALGKQKRMRASNKTAPAGFAFGDAYELDGTLWVPYLPTDGRLWDTGVAT